MAKQSKKKKNVQINPLGEAHIQASFNNIIISLCNEKGQVISWSSAGKMGFRGSKKNTPYAAQIAAEECTKEAFEFFKNNRVTIDLELSFYPFYFASAIAMWLSVLAIILWFLKAISERNNQ